MEVRGGSCLQGSAALGPAERVHLVARGSEEHAFHLCQGFSASRGPLDASQMSLNLFQPHLGEFKQLQAKEECPSPGEEQTHGISFSFLGC